MVFFEVATPRGVRFSRNGAFSLDGQGQLVTKEGWPVLKKSEPGVPPDQRVIRIPAGSSLSISEAGDVLVDGESLGSLSLVQINEPQALLKEGASVYGLKPNMNPQFTPVARPNLKQGFLETSNVNIVLPIDSKCVLINLPPSKYNQAKRSHPFFAFQYQWLRFFHFHLNDVKSRPIRG